MNTAMIYILIMNVIGFCLMGLDMYVFHHKTRHWYFVVGIPLILAAQLALAVYFMR